MRRLRSRLDEGNWADYASPNLRGSQRLMSGKAAISTDIRSADTAVASDVRFHQEIIHATGNHYLRALFAQLAPLLIPRARVDLFKRDRKAKVRYLQRIQQEHAQIYDAIARRDPEAARAAVRLHLSNSRERLRLAMEQTRGRLRGT